MFKIITDLLFSGERGNTLLPKLCTKKMSKVAHSKMKQEVMSFYFRKKAH